jgi:glycosyltransferase involved in cell wall biosynthesis
MLRSIGQEVIVYWGGTKGDVSIFSEEEMIGTFGEYDPTILPVVNWDPTLFYWQKAHMTAVREIEKRIKKGDIVAGIGGAIHQDVFNWFGADFTCIEPGVGYEGLAQNTHACFESYTWMHNRYGAYQIDDGRAFDTVIPNAVDPQEWEMGPNDGYALFVGRVVQRKGPHVAAQIANAAGLKLLIAGAGVASHEEGRIVATDGTVIEGDVKYVGAVSGDDRRKLFANAQVLVCPTLYIGPWEGVHAEAMMSGVPVVAPDYGVFTETLPPPQRYRNMSEAVRAIKEPVWERGITWRNHAESLCSMDLCASMYANWIDRLNSLRDGRNGWYG